MADIIYGIDNKEFYELIHILLSEYKSKIDEYRCEDKLAGNERKLYSGSLDMTFSYVGSGGMTSSTHCISHALAEVSTTISDLLQNNINNRRDIMRLNNEVNDLRSDIVQMSHDMEQLKKRLGGDVND